MTTSAGPHIVPRPPAAAPELRAADQGVADALESVLSDNTKRVYETQWKLFDKRIGKASGQATAPGRCPHRRPTPQARPWHRDPRAGR